MADLIFEMLRIGDAFLRMVCASACLSFGIFGGGFVIWWFGSSIRYTAAEKKARQAGMTAAEREKDDEENYA